MRGLPVGVLLRVGLLRGVRLLRLLLGVRLLRLLLGGVGAGGRACWGWA